MGYSSGATLVYGIIAQARPGTYIGGISLGFCPDIDLPKLLCQTNGLAEKVDITGKSYFLEPNARLGNPWIVLQGKLKISRRSIHSLLFILPILFVRYSR